MNLPYHHFTTFHCRQLGVNVKAVFNVCQTVVPQMRDGGSIVNVSSLASSRAFHGHSAYSISKAGK